jgi:hypothetical protein
MKTITGTCEHNPQQAITCSDNWTVENVINEIRSRFQLRGGGINEDGVALLSTEVIGNTNGVLLFVS